MNIRGGSKPSSPGCWATPRPRGSRSTSSPANWIDIVDAKDTKDTKEHYGPRDLSPDRRFGRDQPRPSHQRGRAVDPHRIARCRFVDVGPRQESRPGRGDGVARNRPDAGAEGRAAVGTRDRAASRTVRWHAG